MRVSYSAISTYMTCPAQYYYRYVEERPSLPSPALSFGQSIHEALRWFYDRPTCDPPSLDEFLEYLECCWISDGYRSKKEEASYFLQAKSTLELFYRSNLQDFRLPAALEHRFIIDLGFCEISGQIDRLDKDPQGGFEIIDYKTNRRLPPASKLAEDLQLPIYHFAVERIWEVSAEKVTFYFVLLNHKHTISMTRDRINKALSEIEKVVNMISSEKFDPVRNNLCPWCDYIDICPEWIGIGRTGARDSTPDIEIGQAADELLLAEKQVALKLSRIEALKEIISSYMNERGYNAISGSRCYVSFDSDGNLSWKQIEERDSLF